MLPAGSAPRAAAVRTARLLLQATDAFGACGYHVQHRPGTLDLSSTPGAAPPEGFCSLGPAPVPANQDATPRANAAGHSRDPAPWQLPSLAWQPEKSATATRSKPSSQKPPEAVAGPESHSGHPDSPAAEHRAQEACSGRSKSPWYSRCESLCSQSGPQSAAGESFCPPPNPPPPRRLGPEDTASFQLADPALASLGEA